VSIYNFGYAIYQVPGITRALIIEQQVSKCPGSYAILYWHKADASTTYMVLSLGFFI
jgi:hypothetical protein